MSSKPYDIYVRVSRVGGRENLISPAEQVRRAEALAKQHGLPVGEVHEDLDESGGKLDRPGLQAALARVEAGASGGVIVAWLDRLSRDSEHAHGLVRRITEAGGKLYAPDAPSDFTTPEGELQAGIMFAFAQYVRSRARAGLERSKAQAIARGIPVHSRPPVGYRKRADRTLEPDPRTAPVVAEVFARRARGVGPAELGEYLQAQGVTTSQGSRTWSKPAVYGLISNRVYLGELSYGTDRRFVNPEAHEPIVDEATWHAAQHPGGRLAPLKGAKGAYLLSGIIRCSACGYALQGTTTSRGKRIYRCTRRHAGGLCPAPARLQAEAVEHAAERAFWQLTRDLVAKGRRTRKADDLDKLQAAHEQAQAALAQWASPEVQAAIGDTGTYAQGLTERRAAMDAAAAALGRARAKAGHEGEQLPIETLQGAWAEMDTRERRELLAHRFDALAASAEGSVVVYPAGTGPAGMPTPGYRKAPTLTPFPEAPRGARVLAL